jgi:hypothetical protein
MVYLETNYDERQIVDDARVLNTMMMEETFRK